jgi:hypothetical protein
LGDDSSQESEQVEVFQTSTLVEAAALCDALAEAGIDAEYSEHTKDRRSRVFVFRAEEQQAQAVVHHFLTREAGPEGATTADGPFGQTEANASSMTVVGKIIAIAGLACVLGGIAQSTLAYISGRRYPEQAVAHPLLDDDLRLPPGESRPQVVGYWYQVNEETFVSRPGTGRLRSAESVRYDPRDPSNHVLGEIVPPPFWLFGGTLIGGMLLFVAWQFGRPSTPEEVPESGRSEKQAIAPVGSETFSALL